MTKDDQPLAATPAEPVAPTPSTVPAATPAADVAPAPATPEENAPASFAETRQWYHQTLATTEALRLELAALREEITQVKARVETIEAHNTESAMHPPVQG